MVIRGNITETQKVEEGRTNLALSTILKLQLVTCYSPSMRSQWPVRTQIRTSMTDRENDSNSAAVKRPQQPKEILENT